MEISAILLLALSGLIHTMWNGFWKSGSDKLTFFWWMLAVCLVIYSPVFILGLARSEISPAGWLFMGISGLCIALYALSLVFAYTRTELSIAYPISRGTSPLFVLILAHLILRERVSLIGGAGIIIVVSGLFLINTRNDKRWFASWRESGVLAALITAFFIACYRIVDKVGVGLVPPLVYYYGGIFVEFCVFSVVMTVRRRWSNTVPEWRKHKKAIIVAGAGMYISYAIVLYVMQGAKISYVGAAANFGIIYSVFWGALFLKERFPKIRYVGAFLLILGIAFIRLG